MTLLGKSEDWFWDSELRIVWNLLQEKKRIDEIRMKNQAIYIANYVWGHDPDAENGKGGGNKEIQGRDTPVDPALLRGFF